MPEAPSVPHRRAASAAAQCKICGVSEAQVQGSLINCKLEQCKGKACLSCCSLMGGPYAEACATCEFGSQFWKDGKPLAPPLGEDDVMVLYA